MKMEILSVQRCHIEEGCELMSEGMSSNGPFSDSVDLIGRSNRIQDAIRCAMRSPWQPPSFKLCRFRNNLKKNLHKLRRKWIGCVGRWNGR